MIDEVPKKLIEFLQQASPLVWEALVRQVYAIAFSHIAWGIAWLVACFGMWKFADFCEKQADEYNEDNRKWLGTKWVFRVLCFLVFFILFSLFVSASMRIFNPDYYAINLILSQIK